MEGKRPKFSWDVWSVVGVGVLGVVVLTPFGVAVAVGVAMRPWLRRRAFRLRSRAKTGEAATNPVVVSSESHMVTRLARMRCTCRGRLAIVEGTPSGEALRMGDHAVWALRGTCARCGATRSVYFEVRVGR